MDEDQPAPEPAVIADGEDAAPADNDLAVTPAADNEAAAVLDADNADPPPPPRSRRRLRIAVVLTLVAAIALLAALQLSGRLGTIARAPTAPAPTRIAVVDAAGALSTMDVLGGNVVPHPLAGVNFAFPTWSPDGLRIAAIGGATDDGAVYVIQARGENAADPMAATAPTVIYRSPEHPAFYAYWTPDGRQVTFLTQEPDRLALRVAPADASTPAATIREGSPLYWDWVGPARALVNIGGGGPGAFLGEIGLDGVAGTPAATTPGSFRSPAVTRDGTHRAFVVAGGAGPASIVVESRDGAGRREIPVPGMAALSFAPAGDNLAFIAPEAPGPPIGLPIGPLRVVDVASGSVRTLLGGAIVGFFWSPDGKTIATLRIPGPGDDEVASVGYALPAINFRPAAPTSGYTLHLAFVDVATGSVRSKRDVRVSERFALQLLPYFDQYALSHRFWSPDSASFMLPLVSEDDVVGIVLLPPDGSAERRVVDGEMGSFSP
jgi:TolB protein